MPEMELVGDVRIPTKRQAQRKYATLSPNKRRFVDELMKQTVGGEEVELGEPTDVMEVTRLLALAVALKG